MTIPAGEGFGKPLSVRMGTLIDYVHSGRPDLSNRQMALLMIVYILPGPHTVRGLSARLRVSKAVVTRALNTLEALRYLRRLKDYADLRNIFIGRTPQGVAFLKAFADMLGRTQQQYGICHDPSGLLAGLP